MRKILLGVCSAFALACNQDSSGVAGDSLDLQPDSVGISIGQTQTLNTVLHVTTSSLTFTSRDNNVATIDNTGKVTGVGSGTTYVIATSGLTKDSSKVVVKIPTALSIPILGAGAVLERFTAEVGGKGNYVYTTTWGSRGGNPGNAVKIWNMVGAVPALVDSIIVGPNGTTSDVQLSPDSSLLAVSVEVSSVSNGFFLYNVSNPAKPTLISKITNDVSMARGVHTLKFGSVAGKLYLFLNINPAPVQMVVYDVTNPQVPTKVGVFPMGNPFIHDVFFRDGILFAALWNDGMSVFDVGGGGKGGSPANPVLLGNVKSAPCPGCAGSEVHNIWWFNDPKTGSKKYAFIGEEGPATIGSWAKGDIHVIDVSDFANMKEVAFFRPDSATSSTGPNPTGTHNFDVDEQSGVLYAAYYNGGVRAIDIRGDLSTCTTAQKSTDGRCNLRLMGRELGIGLTSFPVFVWGVKVMGNSLYVSDMINGVHKLNITALKR